MPITETFVGIYNTLQTPGRDKGSPGTGSGLVRSWFKEVLEGKVLSDFRKRIHSPELRSFVGQFYQSIVFIFTSHSVRISRWYLNIIEFIFVSLKNEPMSLGFSIFYIFATRRSFSELYFIPIFITIHSMSINIKCKFYITPRV